jgi:hypothetical protein
MNIARKFSGTNKKCSGTTSESIMVAFSVVRLFLITLSLIDAGDAAVTATLSRAKNKSRNLKGRAEQRYKKENIRNSQEYNV